MKVVAVTTRFGVLPLLIGLPGCAVVGDHESTGRFEDLRAAERGDNRITDQRIEDSRTAERVREALTTGVDYKYDGVTVLAVEGVVQLSGFVNTSALRDNAGAVAGKVVGVKSVQNNLTFKN